VATEDEYVRAVAELRQPLTRTGTRYAGKYFTFGNEDAPYNFVNHSFAPSLLCHCGVVLARRDLEPGDELTLDYRTLIDTTDVGIYNDALSGREIRGWGARETILRTARELIALVGLSGSEDKYPYELSGGMQQRAAIARALVHDPKLILMDEPFGALDALTREKMNLELLAIWKRSGKTILFVTHGISEAVFLGTRVVVFTTGPARMADNFEISLPEPRTLDIKTSEVFGEYSRRIYHLLGMQ